MDARTVPRPKLQRISQACDFCHRRGLKCIPPAPNPITGNGSGRSADCLTCIEYGQKCTSLRQPKKRGTKPRTRPAQNQDGVQESNGHSPNDHPSRRATELPGSPTGSFEGNRPGLNKEKGASPRVPVLQNYFEIPEVGSFKSRQNITLLIDIYLDSIYPL